MVSFVVGPAFASAINNEQNTKEYNQIFKEFILPYSYGKISKSHFAGTNRVIVNIQDLHCHSKVQKNISNIIKIFDEKYGVNNIYLEGAYGDVSTKWITEKIKNDSSILEKMLDTGRLTGAEYYSALSGKTELIRGLEEKEPFLENITRLGDLLQSQPKINLILKELDNSINDVKKKYYTKRQYKIEKLFKNYKDGKITSQKYYTLLSKHIDKLGIDLTKYENTLIYVTLLDLHKDLNYKQITRELQGLISVLKQQLPYNVYKSLLENTSNFQEVEKLYSYIIQLDKVYNLDISLKYAELDKYFKYIELSKKINPVELVKEDEYLSQEINTRFSQTRAQKEVVFLAYFEKYLKDYISTKITVDDYKYYKENIDSFRQIYNKYVDNRVLSLLDEYIIKTDKFYEVNMDRNIYFTNNMFEEDSPLQYIENPVQATNDINKIIDNMSEVKQLDIVVTGGFHSQTVTELLEKQNVSYIVITPNVTDGIKVAEDIYYEIAKEQSKISFQTIAPLIASLSPQLQAVLLNKTENKDTDNVKQIMNMDDAERVQEISELMAAKILESDDLGDLQQTLNEIIKNLVDEYHKEKVTPELVSEIKNLQRLLKDKENLQKVIDLLSEGTAKQAVMLISDMLDDLYSIFDSFVVSADKQKLESREPLSPVEDFDIDDFFESSVEKEGDFYGEDFEYDYSDELDLWFSDSEIIDLCREIIREGQYNRDIESFISYLGRHNMADYELLSKVLAELKSVKNNEIKKEYCGVLYALIDKDKARTDEEKALETKERIMSFFEKPKLLQLKFCDLFSNAVDSYNDFIKEDFFCALLDFVNKNRYEDRDFEFLFEICEDSRLIAELGTRKNIYDFLSLSIEKRKLLYEFDKSSKNNSDVNINRLTIDFILSVLNKYNFTDEQFNYIMNLICSIDLTDDDTGKKYIEDLKGKNVNLLVLDQFKYIGIYNKYLVDLLFSDIDSMQMKIIDSNIQNIIDLFDDLKQYQIDTLETENKGLALSVFSSVGFKKYCEENNVTDIVKQYQLAIRISRRIHSITGDKFFKLSYDKTEKIIQRTLKYYDSIRQIISLLTLFTNKTAVFSLHNNERNNNGSGFRFTPAGLKKVLEMLEIKPELFEVIELSFLDKVLDFINGIEQDEIDIQDLLDFVNRLDGSTIIKNDIIEDWSHKKKISKDEFVEYLNSLKTTEYFVEVNRLLRIIEHFKDYKQDKGVFIFDGHGHDESFSYSENGALSVKQISKALIKAYNNGVNLENLTLMFESCHSYNFADNIINELKANGITTFPQIITDAGRETVYGYTKDLDIDGTTIRVSNLFYSLLKFLKLKTEEELKQMKGRLTFKDVADAPRYLSNNTMFVTNQQVIEENSKLEADILDIMNEQNVGDIETATAKNDIAYAGTYKVYAEMMLPSTQKALNKIGNIGIIKAVYKEKSGENFRFTTLGVALGALIETFSFWSPNFIKAHNFDPSIQAGMTAVVWAVRALSIGIGFATGTILAIFVTETIAHFLWNRGVILIGRTDLLLQLSKYIKSKKLEPVIVPSVQEKKQARELTEEEKKAAEEALLRTKVRINHSTLEITEENDRKLATEIQEVFNNLLDSMVALGKITEEEKQDYELVFYLDDEINAFTVSGSKTVFISTGMLHSFSLYLQGIVMRGDKVMSEKDLDMFGYSQYMNKQIKDLCKDHIAAILAHELEHTVQDRRVYSSKVADKGDQKKNEYDSDIQAIFMLDKAGYNPMSVQELMEFLVFIEKKGKDNSLRTILDAHPDAENRLVKIKTFLSDRNIFLRSIANPLKNLESSIPYYGENNLRSDIVGKLGYYQKGVGPRDSKGFIKEILEKYGEKITLYKILDIFNSINRFVEVNDVLYYINSVDYPFFNDRIKNFSDNQKKVIIRLMNSFNGYYPSNAELYELCPNMDELKEIFDFIIEPENYFYFFERISFLNISYLVTALHNSGNLGEEDYAKIQKFLSMNEDNFGGYTSFDAIIDKDTVDFYIDKFDLFDNFKKYNLYSELRNCLSKEKNFSASQKEKIRKFFFTPNTGGTAGYHMFRTLDFFELLYPEMTYESYVSSITEEQKKKILEDIEKEEIEKYNRFKEARNREILEDAYQKEKDPDVTSMYEIYKHTDFAYKKFEKEGNKWEGDEKYHKWVSEHDEDLFAEWLQEKKNKWFSDYCTSEYKSLMLEKYESELFDMFSTLDEKLGFLFPGGIMEFDSQVSSRMDYDKCIPKILKKEIDSIKSAEELFSFLNTVVNYFDEEKYVSKKDLETAMLNILLNVDREVLNNFTTEDIQDLFKLGISNKISIIVDLMTVALVNKRRNLDFDKIFFICERRYFGEDYSEEHKKFTTEFVQNSMNREQLEFLLKICYEKDLRLSEILPFDAYTETIEKFDETLSLEEKYRYSIYKDNVYPYNIYHKIKNNEDLKKIPIEHLKRFLGVEIPIRKDYYMNRSIGRIGLSTSFALRIWQNKVSQYRQIFGKSFYDTNSFNEFEGKIKEIEDVFYPWKDQNADNQNAVFSNEVDMLWANLLHNICGFGVDTKSFAFINIHGEEVLNVWCELTPDYDFVPTAQQTNELLNAFVLVKKYLPKDQVVVYARMLYEIIKNNDDLSVFESVEKNLELLDFFFEGFSEIKDDYIYELLENYDIDIDTYNECLSRTTYYSYQNDAEDNGKNFLYRELATVLSKKGMTVEDKIKFLSWLISDKQDKPDFLKGIAVQNDYGWDAKSTRLGEDAKIEIIRNYFWSMMKSERTEFIRELIADILEEGVDGKNYETLKNTLADAFFDSLKKDNNEKVAEALKMSFKIILDSLASHEYRSTSERQILFINDLTDSLVSISKSNFSPEEKEARQIGRFIVAMGAASGVAVVKILQILSNSKAFEGLGEQGYIINEEISKVRSSNEQLSKRVVFQQLEDLGILEDVESVGKCLGSASIGVTYLINMKDGSKRIIKIKRPSVLKNYEQDLNTAEKLIDYFKFSDILPQQNRSMIPTIKFLKQVFDTELNFEDEVENLLRAKVNLSRTDIHTPDIAGNYNADSFIQTLASGQSFDNAKNIYSEQEKAEIYSKILLEFFREVFVDGFFHADLHEGNVFIDENKNITFIDWGACGYVEKSKSDNLKTVFVSLLLSDSSNFMESLKQYDIDLYNKTSIKTKEIVAILDSNDSLEIKFGKIFTIFNQIDMSQNHDFLMFIQGLSKIAKYIDNLSAKEKILLLLDDTVIYDLLKNKQILSNISGLLGKIVPNRYRKIINFAIEKLVASNEENLQNIITNFKLFIINEDKQALERLINNILNTLNLPKSFKMPLKSLMSKKMKQLLDNIDSYSLKPKTNSVLIMQIIKEKFKSFFKLSDFIKKRLFNKTKKAKIKIEEESEPIVVLIQKNGVQYSLVMELVSSWYEKDNNNAVDIGLKNKKLSVYLSSIGKEGFSKKTSKYTSVESIEEFLGIKIDISNQSVSVTSEDMQTDIKYIKYEDMSEIVSGLKGNPIVALREEEAETLKQDSGCDVVEYIFLDQNIESNKIKIEEAIKTESFGRNKVLFALYPFSNVYDIDSLSDEQLFALYFQLLKSFEDIAEALSSRNHFYRINNEEITAIRFSILEMIQNAFISGNASLSKPIYISCTYDGGEQPFTVYCELGNETISEKQKNLATAIVNGRKDETRTIRHYQEKNLITEEIPQEKRIRQIGEEKYYKATIAKVFRFYYDESSKWDSPFGFGELEDDEFLDLEDLDLEGFEDLEDSSFEKGKTIERKIGIPLTRNILDWLGEKLYKGDAGKNFKFTSFGLALGAVIEAIPFWFPNFISAHNFDSSVKPGMIAVVWVIRALSIGIGYATGAIWALLLAETVLHYAWNQFVILIGRQDLLLQTSQQKSKEEEITIPVLESKEEKGRDLSQEEKDRYEQHLQKTILQNDIRYQYQPNPELQKDIEEIFGNLLDAMVAQGKITPAERKQYRIHYYYSPVANAYTVINSKDVFIFSELLYELANEMQREGKELTKDHIAAILAHELQHTTQNNKVYKGYSAVRGDNKRKEYDADRESIFILEQAGYNPRAVEEMMTALSFLSDANLLQVFFDAHPDTKDRLKEISEILENPSLVFLSMTKTQQTLNVSSLQKYGQDFQKYLDANFDKGTNYTYSLEGKALQKILAETEFFDQISIFDISNDVNFYDSSTKDFIINNILNGNYKFFTEAENDFIKNCNAEEKEFIYSLLFRSSDSDTIIEKLENKQKTKLFDFCISTLEPEKIKNSNLLSNMVATMDPTQATLNAYLDFRKNNGKNISSYTKETAYFYLKNYKYLTREEISSLLEELIPYDRFSFLYHELDEYKLSSIFDSFSQEQKNESIKIILNVLTENKDLYVSCTDPVGFINFVMASDVLTKQEKLEYLLKLSRYMDKHKPMLANTLLNLFDDLYSDKTDFEKLVQLFEVLNASENIYCLTEIFSYNELIDRYGISEHDFDAEELKNFAFAIKNFTLKFDVFFLGYFLKIKNPNVKFYFVTDEYATHDKKYSDGVCLYPNMNIEKINRDLLENITLEDLIEFQNFMMGNNYYCQSVSLLACYIVDNVLTLNDEEKIKIKKLLTLLPKRNGNISINGDISAIPYEYLKNLVDLQIVYKDIYEQSRSMPAKETSFINFYVPFLEFRTFHPNYSETPFAQTVEDIKKHFDAYLYLEEFSNAEDDNLQIYYSETEEMGNPDVPEKQIKNMEIEKAWLFELHKIFNLAPEERNVEFGYDGENFVYTYFEISEQLLNDTELIPTAQQAQQLINAFSIIKKELPRETVDVYAKLVYSLLKRNSSLSVFSSAEKNLELLDLLFEDFSVVKDDYIKELLDNYNITVEEYKKIISKTRLYFFSLNSEDNNEDISSMEMINNILPTLSDSEKIKFFFWLISGNAQYKPQMLKQVKIVNFNYDGEINFDSLQQSFRLMTKTERENFIRKILLGKSGIIENGKANAERNSKEFEQGLKNILFDDFFIASLGSSKIKASSISIVFKEVFSIVFNNLSDERKVLFVNNLISAIAEIKTNEEAVSEEQKARQLGRLIVALGTSSGVAVVKLLQILSNNRVFEALDDKYGTIINEEVAKVKSENEPLSKSVVFQYLEKMGVFSAVQYIGKRLGSASIGLTFFLKLKDISGLVVAKIKRPNINKTYDEDFKIADKLIEYFKSEKSLLDDVYKKTLPDADTLKTLFDEELDFERESDNLKDFSKQLQKRNSKIKVSQLIQTINGTKAYNQNLFLQTTAKGTTLDKVQVSKKEKSRIYFEVLKEFFTEVFVDPIKNGQALYHADLHTGNIFVDEDGNISFIDLGGVGKVTAQQSKALKDVFMYLYSGKYVDFINALKAYNSEIYDELEKENALDKIEKILNRKTSLESKFVDLFEIFNSLKNVDSDFMMFIQAISKIAGYLDNLSKEDQLSLLNNLSFDRGIQFKIIADNVLTYIVSVVKKIHFGKKQQEVESHEITQEEIFREKLLSSYPDITNEEIDLLLSLDNFVLESIRSNTVSLTKQQLIRCGKLADKLYKEKVITEQNNKIGLLFKIFSITNFSDANIEKLLSLDENTIEKIISEITENKQIEILFVKAEQLNIDLVYENKSFLSENRKFDRLLMFAKGDVLSTSQDILFMFNAKSELEKANLLFGLPVILTKILLEEENKLSSLYNIVKDTNLSLDEDGDVIEILASFSETELNNIEFNLRTLSNGEQNVRRFIYLYKDYRNVFSGKDGLIILSVFVTNNENDEQIRDFFDLAIKNNSVGTIKYIAYGDRSFDIKLSSEFGLGMILFRSKALDIPIDENNRDFVYMVKTLKTISSTGQERISNLDKDTYEKLFSIKKQDSFIRLLEYISGYRYYDRRGFKDLLNKALLAERTEIRVDYDGREIVTLIINKDEKIYSVRVALDSITEEDKIRQDYIETSFPNKKRIVYLSSVGDDAFSKTQSEYKTLEDIEKLTGVKIEVSDNTIVAKSVESETYVSYVKNREISQIVSSLYPIQILAIDRQQQADVEKLVNAEVTETIYLDESPDKVLEKLERAIANNSLIVIYPFSHTYDINSLTDEQLYALYFDIQSKFLDLQELLEDNNCLPQIKNRRSMAYILKEFMKNAFVHGSLSDTSEPIYIKFIRDGFTVINAKQTSKDERNRLKSLKRLYLSAAATLTGNHRGLQIIQDLEREGLIRVTPEENREIVFDKKEYFAITAVKTQGQGFSSLMEKFLDIALIDTSKVNKNQEETIEYKNNMYPGDRVFAQKEAEKFLESQFSPEELEIIDLLASVIFDSIKYVNCIPNTSSIEFVNIAYALQNGYFNYNLFPKEGEDLKQHILGMLSHYVEVSKQKKGAGQDNILIKALNENGTLLNDMADYLCDIITKNDLINKNKLETEQRNANMKKFIEGVHFDNTKFAAVMICSANENRSAIWHIMLEDYLERHRKQSTKVYSAGVFYDISQATLRETNETRPLVDEYIETLNSDERYKDINENLKKGFRSRYIKYLNVPRNSQPVFIVAGEQHRAKLIQLGYDPAWIFLMSDFYSKEFIEQFKQNNPELGQDLEDNNIFSMSEFPDPYENQILRQDLPELVRSVIEYNFDIEVEQKQVPEEFINLTDDYNQFEHMEGLPDFSDTGREEKRRQNAIELFNDQLEDISSKTYQFVFRGNTKYLYLLQNRENKHILLNIASQPNIDLKFRLFALLYLDELSYDLTSEERTRINQAEKAIVKKLKKQIENNEFEVLNNLDLRAYMMGVYLMLRDHADKINVPDIINRAIIINPYGKKMARDDGLFAEVDLFIVIHELAHRMFYKPRYTDDTLEEFVSYIVPNIFLRKIMNLSFEAYSKTQNLYTIHQTDGVIDHIKMGRKFHSLYSMFDKNAEEYKFKQEDHSAPIAFLDYLFAAHQKAGKPIDWDVLLDVIRNLSVSGLDQLQMFGRILDLYMKRSVEKGSLTKEETENMKKEIEEMQTWTILVKEVMEIIESTSPNIFNLLKGNKKTEEYKTEILSTTKEMKETFEKFSNAFMMNFEFSKSELLVLLIMNIMKNVEYEQLENNFDGVINGIIDVINNVSGELKVDFNKDKFNQQEYKQILNFVLANYAVSEHVETSVTNDIYTYISKNLDYLSFATKLINMVFGTRDLTKIFSNKKLLIATSKQQEEDFVKLLSGRAEKDIAVVTMEVIKDHVYDIREGSFLDVQKGIKATYDSKENKIIVYSKEGINITEDEIKGLITEQYFSERKDDTFDDVIAFADVNDSSLQDITDRLNIAYTEAVSIPNKETTFDLSSRKSIKNIINVCEQESRATGIKTFIVTFEQAKEFPYEIQTLQERDFKFIVSCKIDDISTIKYYDGLIIDDSKTDYEDISQLLPVMEKVRKHVLKTGVAKPVSVKFSNSTYGKFNSAGINIFDTYGMLPIVEDSYMTNSIIGKFIVEKIRDNNIERFLRQNNVVGFVIDNARTFADKKIKLRDLFSKEHKYNKGYNAALSSKFDYTCADVKILANYLDIEIVDNKASEKTDEQKLYKQKLDKQKLEELKRILSLYGQNSREEFSSELLKNLSFDSKAYLKYLADKNRDEELLGFIRGIAMNSARTQVFKGLEEKGFNLDMKKFANVADGKYQKAFLTIAVQLMMEDIDITELLETDFIDSDMTAKEYLDSILEKVNINIEEILKQNEYKIEKIEKEDIPKTIEDFKNYVVLLDNLKIIKDTTAGLDMSIKAVRSMLSAA